MPSTLTPGRPAAIGQDGQDTPIPLELPGRPELPGLPEPPGSPELPGRPGPRLITVPAGWPPYDCETHGAACPAVGGAAVNAGGAALADAAADGEDQAGARHASARQAEADQATAWARQFAQVLVEILAGARPSRQVIRWTTEPVRAQIDHLSHELRPGRRPKIQRIVTSRPTARVVEMTVVLSFGPRSKALAMRLEHVPGRRPAPGRPARPARWLCTEIEVG
jgi:Family of unknown function (DUF6459)